MHNYTSVSDSMAQRFCPKLLGGGKSLYSLLIVLAVFLIFGFSSCSSDDSVEGEELTSTRISDLNALLVSHDWEVTEASSIIGLATCDMLNGRTYCQFSYNKVSFTQEVLQYSFDGTSEGTKIVPAGEYSYAVKEGNITIDNQIFTVSTGHRDRPSTLKSEPMYCPYDPLRKEFLTCPVYDRTKL